MRTRPHLSVAVILLMLQLGACTTWRPTVVGPRELIERERPPRIRVTRLDGAVMEIRNPRVENDSIAVVSGECRPRPSSSGYICPTTSLMSLDQVRAVEIRGRARGRTGLFILPAVLVVIPLLAVGAAY